jgi:hypothetical protein
MDNTLIDFYKYLINPYTLPYSSVLKCIWNESSFSWMITAQTDISMYGSEWNEFYSPEDESWEGFYMSILHRTKRYYVNYMWPHSSPTVK